MAVRSKNIMPKVNIHCRRKGKRGGKERKERRKGKRSIKNYYEKLHTIYHIILGLCLFLGRANPVYPMTINP